MRKEQSVRYDDIPIEVWKCMREREIVWLIKYSNNILKMKRIPQEHRKNSLLLMYKNKWDIQNFTNYCDIKLMSHTLKLWEKIIEYKLSHETNIRESNCF